MKKLLASMIGLSILITTFGVTVNAVNTRNLLDSVPRVIISSYEITNDDIDEIIPLYNFDESIIAYCLIYKDNGYIIYDNNGNMIVRSDEGKPLFYQINKPIYITGPTGYYYKDKNSFINILNSNINKYTIEYLANEYLDFNLEEYLSEEGIKEENTQLNLFDNINSIQNERKINETIDGIKNKFGKKQ